MRIGLIILLFAFSLVMRGAAADGGHGVDPHAYPSPDWCPDGHGPIGVMGDHTHNVAEWMLSYRYMFMNMDGGRNGTSRLSEQDVFAEGFMVAPTNNDYGYAHVRHYVCSQ